MMSEPEDSSRREELRCAATEGAPADARRFVDELLESSPHRDAAKLVVSELVTNAVRHGGRDAGHIDIAIEIAGAILLEVSQPDHSGFVASIRSPGIDDATGRGLMIVDAVSSSWGVEESNGRVWARFGG